MVNINPREFSLYYTIRASVDSPINLPLSGNIHNDLRCIYNDNPPYLHDAYVWKSKKSTGKRSNWKKVEVINYA